MVFPDVAYSFDLPKMVPVKQLFPDEHIESVDDCVKKEFAQESIQAKIRPGDSVAVLVGSRGIARIAEVIRCVVRELKAIGADPFIVPAMGSHGDGKAALQKEILESYGITEAFTGAPIRSSMETVVVGETPEGIPVHVDKNASLADAVVPVCRVKAHTDFHGKYESGICKMLAIGIGKHNGCSRIHKEPVDDFPTVIPNYARVVMEKLYVPFAVAIVENAHEHIHTLKAVPGEKILEEEPGLLCLSKSLMPSLQFPHIDVLVVQQIGKEISGTGMDPNIIGRLAEKPPTEYYGPTINRVVVNDLSPASHNNGNGIGVADYTTRRVLEKMDFDAMYTNCVASADPRCGRMPIVLDSEEDALRAAVFSSFPKNGYAGASVVWILDTLYLTEIKVSESLLDYCRQHPGFAVPDTDR